MELVDFSKCPISNRHGIYGGQAGDKDGIIYNNEFWIVKFPKSTKSMKGDALDAYTTSPLSEYLGSHIYQILGYDTHDTLLGIRNGKIVVACKDFCETRGALAEVRTLKNAANRQISEALGEDEIPVSLTGDSVNLNELFLHLNVNKLLSKKAIIERFWNTAVVDVFINNNDRNNGNWGLLFNEKKNRYVLAPIYDNGNSFYNKMSEEKLKKLLMTGSCEKVFASSRTSFILDGKELSPKAFMALDNGNLKDSLRRNVPLIEEKLPVIKKLIQSIPEKFGKHVVCSPGRKAIYSRMLDYNLENVLLPAYRAISIESVCGKLSEKKALVLASDGSRQALKEPTRKQNTRSR
ncbi:MAG: CtkA family protein [Lachnospiraceae bacterium]|nr:CtkA family protein [Lachnospiraceae bacterium]